MGEFELKPCPFCGGEAELDYSGRLGWHVKCKSCADLLGGFDYPDVAVEHWNARAALALSKSTKEKEK
jgi:hypothetical protein